MRRFTYLPIGPRLVRLFGSSNMAHLVQSHSSRVSSFEMYDIHDSPQWDDNYRTIFCGDKRGISFALNTDGVNPFKHLKAKYSMWPIMLTLLNLPRHLRYTFQNIWLLGIVPSNGPKEPATLDPYLEVVVDEILSLSNKVIYDAYSKAFKLKLHLMFYVLDYPGICKVYNTLGSGAYQGCNWCTLQGEYSLLFPLVCM